MRYIKLHTILLLLLLFTTISYSQKIDNGWYKNVDSNYRCLYVHNDTILHPYYSGTMSISILKGVIDKKKWINIIPVENKMKGSYKVVEKRRSDGVSIVRFNLYDYVSGERASDWYDGSSLINETYLTCGLVYTTPQNKLIKKDTALIFNGNYFEVDLPSDSFIDAELTIRGHGKYITVPILKDTLLSVNIIQSPSVYYYDDYGKQKRIKYKYSGKDQSIEIKFLGGVKVRGIMKKGSWQKYIKTEEPCNYWRHQRIIEKHIN